jgi:aspartate aminotransferase/aminotransferase
MQKLQQFTFVCPPSPFQHAAVAAWNCDVSGIVDDYRKKRDRLVHGLRNRFEFTVPGGAFYLFAKAPRGTASEFVTRAVERNLLLIAGSTFSRRDTHFRISAAADDAVLNQGIDILNDLANS